MCTFNISTILFLISNVYCSNALYYFKLALTLALFGNFVLERLEPLLGSCRNRLFRIEVPTR